ncbi:MAG TPA: DUF5677 domain-containing protein [bacterium]|jgi:hypothetical protein
MREKDKSDLSISEIAESAYQATCSIRNFLEKNMVPILEGALSLNEKESAIVGTYYNMLGWLNALAVLNSPKYFQTVAAASRSLFESLVDLHFLAGDLIAEPIKKFHAFTEVERLRGAKDRLDFFQRHPNEVLYGFSPAKAKEYITPEREESVKTICLELWGTVKSGKIPRRRHWSGIDSLYDRAKKISPKYEGFYVQLYPLFSWFVHPGPQGYSGIKSEMPFESLCGLAHVSAQQFIIEGTKICGKEMKISICIESFYRDLDNLADKFAEIMLKRRK